MDKPRINAIAPWMGSKRKLAKKINELLGPRDAYFEPFFGSGAVLFASPPARHEVVNDLNRDLVNVSKVLQDPQLARELLGRLHYTICAEELYKTARKTILIPFTDPPGDVERAYCALVYWWMGRNGIAGTRPHGTGFSARFTPRGGSGGVRFRNFVGSVPWFTQRLARVDVLNTDGIEMIGKIEDLGRTVIYVDPPYFKKAKPYLHDFTDDDHAKLGMAAGRFKRARVIVSYYPDPRIEEFYSPRQWSKIEIITNKNIRNTITRKCGAVKATELLLCNFKPTVEARLFV
jgi:DNA adenine methylase